MSRLALLSFFQTGEFHCWLSRYRVQKKSRQNSQTRIVTFMLSLLTGGLGIPPTQVAISLVTFVAYIIPPAACYFAAAVLAITPQTRAIQVGLCPIIVLLAFRAAVSVDMSHGKPERKFWNVQLLRIMTTIVIDTLSWTIAKKPLVRHLRPVNSSPSTIMDALDLVTTCRGYGWDWSCGLYIPRDTRPTSRTAFAFYALFSAITQLVICLVLVQAIQTFVTDAGSSLNAHTIFDETFPFAVQQLRASIITILAAFVTYSSLQMGYDIFTLIGIILFRQDLAQWPPAFEKPWCATSLSDFWGRRWHQWFRHMFLTCAYPLQTVFGRAGMVIGAFLASGVLHHLFMLAYDRQSDMWRMLVPFGVMGPALLAERAFYKMTGRKVGGVVGWVWTMAWLVVWGNVMTEGFARGGMFAQSDGQPPVFPVANDLVIKLDAWLHTI